MLKANLVSELSVARGRFDQCSQIGDEALKFLEKGCLRDKRLPALFFVAGLCWLSSFPSMVSQGCPSSHLIRTSRGVFRATTHEATADSDVKPAAIPIKHRPPFRYEAGHH
ncbi:hypothetical protein, partial [Mesorhizobium sp.]|uniref:hypothetical protein n=1 Tax=Mesorhizobium sp. TaxID=1871066 RepID=UPI0025BFED73